MKNLLVLKDDKERSDELAILFNQAGYQVTQIDGLRSCCNYLLAANDALGADSEYRYPTPSAIPDLASHDKGVTILSANEFDAGLELAAQLSGLPAFIISLARRLTPGWRLNIRNRVLEAPNHKKVDLTSLEFSFIKIFALVDPGESVSRKKIVQEFGEDYLSYDQNRLDTMVRRLRKKVDQEIGVRLPLNTVRVRGFAFDDVLIIDI
jgi:DNA-binding response OmpR family regulator